MTTINEQLTEKKDSDKKNVWKVFIADDEEPILNATKLIISNTGFDPFSYKNVLLDIQCFDKVYDTLKALEDDSPENPDVAAIILDIDMDERGFKVVDFLRKEKNNYMTQIILRTGKAGQMIRDGKQLPSEYEMIRDYEVNDYIAKTENDKNENLRIRIALTTCLRTFELLKERKIDKEKQLLYISLIDHFIKNETPKINEQELKKLLNDIFFQLSLIYGAQPQKILSSKALEKIIKSGIPDIRRYLLIMDQVIKVNHNIIDPDHIEEAQQYASNTMIWRGTEEQLKQLYNMLTQETEYYNQLTKRTSEILFIKPDFSWEEFRKHHFDTDYPSNPIPWMTELVDLVQLYCLLYKKGFFDEKFFNEMHCEFNMHYRIEKKSSSEPRGIIEGYIPHRSVIVTKSTNFKKKLVENEVGTFLGFEKVWKGEHKNHKLINKITIPFPNICYQKFR